MDGQRGFSVSEHPNGYVISEPAVPVSFPPSSTTKNGSEGSDISDNSPAFNDPTSCDVKTDRDISGGSTETTDTIAVNLPCGCGSVEMTCKGLLESLQDSSMGTAFNHGILTFLLWADEFGMSRALHLAQSADLLRELPMPSEFLASLAEFIRIRAKN